MMTLTWVVPSVILLAGVVDDLRSRKVHNELVLACLFVAAAYTFYAGGLAGLGTGLLGMGAALFMTLPLVLFGILGAGDLKLFLAFGLATSWSTAVYVGIAALIWGAIFGVFRAAAGGELKALFANTMNLASRKPAGELHRIPYTIALLMGWLTYLAEGWRAA